jgi:hypothetical protein
MNPMKRSTNTNRVDLLPSSSNLAARCDFLIRINRISEITNSKGRICPNFSSMERNPSPVASAHTAQISSGKRGIEITPVISHRERFLLLTTFHACAMTKETVINKKTPQKMMK